MKAMRELRTKNSVIEFDTNSGGAPVKWCVWNSSNSFVNPDTGEAFQITWDIGQDGTQTSANGRTLYPIKRINENHEPKLDAYNYYIRENNYTGFRNTDTEQSYEVEGVFPFFWLSHDMREDCIPLMLDGSLQTAWVTQYKRREKSKTTFEIDDVPIWFNGININTGASLWLGDVFKTAVATDLPHHGPVPDEEKEKWYETLCGSWNKRLLKIPYGQVSFRVRIKFEDRSEKARLGFAGVMFRKKIPSNSSKLTTDDAYLALGYFCSVNALGKVQLRKRNHSQRKEDDLVREIELEGEAKSSLYNDGGLLEMRTHNIRPGSMSVYFNHKFLFEYDDRNPILGEYTGLYAQTKKDCRIKFSDREIFDVGVIAKSRFWITPSDYTNNSVHSAISVKTVDGRPRPFYRVNHVIFLHPKECNELNTILANNKGPYKSEDREVIRQDVTSTSWFWAGREDGSSGLQCDNIQCYVNEKPALARTAHADLGFMLSARNPYLHLNAISPRDDNNPKPTILTSSRILARWSITNTRRFSQSKHDTTEKTNLEKDNVRSKLKSLDGVLKKPDLR